jgi:nicotinamidase-related amidase
MPLTEIPDLPAPVPVQLDRATTALLVLDMSDRICGPNPYCIATVPNVQRLLERARTAGMARVFALGRGEQSFLPELAPGPDEPVVRSSANKFYGTDLEQHLSGKKTLVVTGVAANGAVLYTCQGAVARGFTVVVAEDGISSREPIATWFGRWQLLNAPGASNPTNEPLRPEAVTLSRTDLIRF